MHKNQTTIKELFVNLSFDLLSFSIKKLSVGSYKEKLGTDRMKKEKKSIIILTTESYI